jgi:hypothetical protein
MHWPGHRFALTFFASVIAIWLVVMFVLMRKSALPDDATGTMLVVFDPGTPKDLALVAIVNAGAKPIRETAFGFIWVVNGSEAGLSGRLKSNGALGAYRELPINASIAGCVAVVDAKAADAFGM